MFLSFSRLTSRDLVLHSRAYLESEYANSLKLQPFFKPLWLPYPSWMSNSLRGDRRR